MPLTGYCYVSHAAIDFVLFRFLDQCADNDSSRRGWIDRIGRLENVDVHSAHLVRRMPLTSFCFPAHWHCVPGLTLCSFRILSRSIDLDSVDQWSELTLVSDTEGIHFDSSLPPAYLTDSPPSSRRRVAHSTSRDGCRASLAQVVLASSPCRRLSIAGIPIWEICTPALRQGLRTLSLGAALQQSAEQWHAGSLISPTPDTMNKATTHVSTGGLLIAVQPFQICLAPNWKTAKLVRHRHDIPD